MPRDARTTLPGPGIMRCFSFPARQAGTAGDDAIERDFEEAGEGIADMGAMRTADPHAEIVRAVAVLRRGGVVALPTETVYGLAADASNPTAVARVFAIKGRPADHPLIVHIASADQLDHWARSVPETARRLAAAFWPGPLTLVLLRAAHVADAVTGGLDTVALRVPSHPLALEVLRAFGGGLAAPSANRYGRVSPTTATDVRDELGGVVDLILDGGPCGVGLESTIVDLASSTPRVLRPGAVTEAMLEDVLGNAVPSSADPRARAPGRKPSHYAPRARVVLAEDAGEIAEALDRHLRQGHRVGVLSSHEPRALPQAVAWLRLPESIEAQAQVLYARLREADRLGLDVLIAVPPADDSGLASAIRDRLVRAAGPRPEHRPDGP
jgi:L-threonylcarbamoyladenylate synthase